MYFILHFTQIRIHENYKKKQKKFAHPKTKTDKNKHGCKVCTRKPFHIDLSANQNENLNKFFYHILFLWPQVPIRSWIPGIFGPFSPFYPFFWYIFTFHQFILHCKFQLYVPDRTQYRQRKLFILSNTGHLWGFDKGPQVKMYNILSLPSNQVCIWSMESF